MTNRMTPEQKAQQIAADCTEWMRQMRLATSHDELDRMMAHVRDQAKRRGIAHPIMQHFERVTYAETAAGRGPRKPKAKPSKSAPPNYDHMTGEVRE